MTAQQAFLRMYILSKPYEVRAALWPSAVNKQTGVTDFTGDPEGFTDADRQAAAIRLLARGYTLDQVVDIFGWDPWTTMLSRLEQNIMWVWPGTNQGQDNTLVGGGHPLPVPDGAIKTSLDPADYPPIPDPPPDMPPAPPPTPKMTNPVGPLILPSGAPGGIGSLFHDKANDGYGDGETWSGTAYGHRGTFTKAVKMAGMMRVWELTAL